MPGACGRVLSPMDGDPWMFRCWEHEPGMVKHTCSEEDVPLEADVRMDTKI